MIYQIFNNTSHLLGDPKNKNNRAFFSSHTFFAVHFLLNVVCSVMCTDWALSPPMHSKHRLLSVAPPASNTSSQMARCCHLDPASSQILVDETFLCPTTPLDSEFPRIIMMSHNQCLIHPLPIRLSAHHIQMSHDNTHLF